jgi:hypothetical protein
MFFLDYIWKLLRPTQAMPYKYLHILGYAFVDVLKGGSDGTTSEK